MKSSSQIHPTALVDSKAVLGAGVAIGPYTVIGAGVRIGDETTVGAHGVIEPGVVIGKANRISHGVILGSEPQSKGFAGPSAGVRIGDHNVIREYVTIHAATSAEQPTRIGHHNFIMANTHIAHDMDIADEVVIANGTVLAGFVEIQTGAFVSGLVGAHQFVRIGCYSMVGGLSRIVKDILPYGLYEGNPVRLAGINLVGLRRAQFSKESIRDIRETYKKLFFSAKPFRETLGQIQKDLADKDSHVVDLIRFIESSKRGFVGRSPRGGLLIE